MIISLPTHCPGRIWERYLFPLMQRLSTDQSLESDDISGIKRVSFQIFQKGRQKTIFLMCLFLYEEFRNPL